MKEILRNLSLLSILLCTVGCDLPITSHEPEEPVVDVVINEVNTDAKYIELYNRSGVSVDLSGATIIKNNEGPLDNIDESGPFVVAEGTVLPPYGFAVLNCKGKTNVYDGVNLGTSDSGISGSKSLLLELVDRDGRRLDYFVNTASQTPSATDEWDGEITQEFDVAMRIGDGGENWYINNDKPSPGLPNSGTVVVAFTMKEVDFSGSTGGGSGDNGGGTVTPDPGVSDMAQAVAYVWDESTFPKITLTVSEEEWNNMLKTFDQNNDTKQYFKGDVTFDNGSKSYAFEEAGWRLRGNTSRRRPEGNGGEVHNSENPDWHHCHFQINFRKYHKDSAHTINGVRKVYLKWFKDDPAYVREIYCYDLFRRYGVWTAINNIYCRLWVHVEGDKEPAYYGVYEMLETIDDEYLETRSDKFGGHKGNLWKCTYGRKGKADLKDYSDESKFGLDQDTDEEWPYELKTEHNSFDSAKSQLIDFMRKLNSMEGTAMHDWFGEIMDVPLFLKTYAVNVTVGMWDDYWNNANNYYLYFNAPGTSGYKFFFIPYDYDNTLGTSQATGRLSDSGRDTPLKWGSNYNHPLVSKVLQFEDYKALYVSYLKELVDPSKGYFDQATSVARIKAWHNKISPYVSNDTDEDMEIRDRPASWSNHGEYRLLEDNNNFFKVKAETYASILN